MPKDTDSSNLSSYATGDIYDSPYTGADEDNAQYDCHFWNDNGHATTANMQSYNVAFPGSHQAVVTLSGLGQDPLEVQFGGIQWQATITLNTTDPNNPTAQASFSHTCYPAHNVKVNGTELLDQQPQENDTSYLVKCLTGINSWTGRSSDVKSVPTH